MSVESGIGWIPFILEALAHQQGELPPGVLDYMTLSPLEYFQRNMYACFWFEQQDVAHTLDLLGADNILFETDFPHPTCLYPDSMVAAAPGSRRLDCGGATKGAAGQRGEPLPHPAARKRALTKLTEPAQAFDQAAPVRRPSNAMLVESGRVSIPAWIASASGPIRSAMRCNASRSKPYTWAALPPTSAATSS